MKVVRSQDIAKYRHVALRFFYDDEKFLGALPANSQFKILIHGGSFTGKSSYTIDLAAKLARFGNVLYGNFEEPTHGGSIQNKLRIMQVRDDRIHFIEPNTYDNFISQLRTGKYKFAILDSLSVLGDSRKAILEKFNIYEQFPDVSFVFLLHADKSEKTYIGPSALKHNVDVAIEVIDRICYMTKNRFKTSENIEFKEYDIFKKRVISPQERRQKDGDFKKTQKQRQTQVKRRR